MDAILETNDIEILANQARNSISDYCSKECNALCCRSEHILLTELEVINIMHMKPSSLEIIKEDLYYDDRKYIFNLGSQTLPCPNLKDLKCTIHKNPDRPKACKEFPLFIWQNKTIMVSFRCPAAKENKLYPYLAKFKSLGYNILYDEE
jgi:Fe-S-cluster containining protein